MAPASSTRAARRGGARSGAAASAPASASAASAASDEATATAPVVAVVARARRRQHQDPTPQHWRASLARLAGVVAAGRLAFLVLVAALARLLPDYDTSAELTSGDCGRDWPLRAAAAAKASAAAASASSSSSSSSSSSWTLPPPSPSSWGVVWDAVFYHRIAACGYEYEQFAAFFPGLPWLAGGLARLFVGGGRPGRQGGGPLLPLPPRAFAAAAVLANNAAFVGAAVLLAHLGRAVLGGVDAGEEEDEEESGEQQQQPTPAKTRRRAAAAAAAVAERASLAAALLYGLQPAAIFTAIPYTESLFALLTFAGLCCLYCTGGGGGGQGGPRSAAGAALALFRFEAAALLLCLAASLRSNGAVNAAFLLHEGAAVALAGIQRAWQQQQRQQQQRQRHPQRALLAAAAAAALLVVARACLCAAAVLAPYIFFQRHIAALFCDGAPVRPMAGLGWGGGANEQGGVAALRLDPRPDWCGSSSSSSSSSGGGGGATLLPLRSSYAHVQARYWAVGPLAYWKAEQLPNFLLAAPALALTAAGAVGLYLRARPGTLLTGGLLPASWEAEVAARLGWAGAGKGEGKRRSGGTAGGGGGDGSAAPFSTSRRAAVFVVQWSALAVFAALTMNVQVSTRMLCASCPALYWAAAEIAGLGQGQEEEDEEQEQEQRRRGGGLTARGGQAGPRAPSRSRFALWAWCFGFAIAGAVLSPQFLPWT